MMKAIRYLFWFWICVGAALMLFYKVPDALAFSNGFFLVLFALYALSLQWKEGQAKPSRLLGLALLTGVSTYLLEWLGTETGWPFGVYSYTDTLRFWNDGVPLAIGFAWIGVMTTSLMLSPTRVKWKRALQVGLYAVCFDLVLDPVSFSMRFWIWSGEATLPWSYYGVPIQNFAAWFVTAALLSFFYPVQSKPLSRKLEHNLSIRKEAGRLYQGMYLLFGLLALKEQLWGPFATAIAAIAVIQGGTRGDQSKQTQAF